MEQKNGCFFGRSEKRSTSTAIVFKQLFFKISQLRKHVEPDFTFIQNNNFHLLLFFSANAFSLFNHSHINVFYLNTKRNLLEISVRNFCLKFFIYFIIIAGPAKHANLRFQKWICLKKKNTFQNSKEIYRNIFCPKWFHKIFWQIFNFLRYA